MNEYVVTDAAGKEVAGQRNPGVGATITLTKEQAAHPLRLGHIRSPLDHDGDGRKGGSKAKRGKN